MCETTPNFRIQQQNQQDICRSLFTLLALGSWQLGACNFRYALSSDPSDHKTGPQPSKLAASIPRIFTNQQLNPWKVHRWLKRWVYGTWDIGEAAGNVGNLGTPRGDRAWERRLGCSWQMRQVMEVPRSGDASLGLAASATGHVAFTRKLSWYDRHSTVPSWNPSSANMARNFCSVRSCPPFLLLTSSLSFTPIQHSFFWFRAASRHASMNLSFAAATSGWTKRSVSISYNRRLSAASRWACAVVWLNSWMKDMALKVWRFCGLVSRDAKGWANKKHVWPSIHCHSTNALKLNLRKIQCRSNVHACSIGSLKSIQTFLNFFELFHDLSPTATIICQNKRESYPSNAPVTSSTPHHPRDKPWAMDIPPPAVAGRCLMVIHWEQAKIHDYKSNCPTLTLGRSPSS